MTDTLSPLADEIVIEEHDRDFRLMRDAVAKIRAIEPAIDHVDIFYTVPYYDDSSFSGGGCDCGYPVQDGAIYENKELAAEVWQFQRSFSDMAKVVAQFAAENDGRTVLLRVTPDAIFFAEQEEYFDTPEEARQYVEDYGISPIAPVFGTEPSAHELLHVHKVFHDTLPEIEEAIVDALKEYKAENGDADEMEDSGL
jgi:hypothetical protein